MSTAASPPPSSEPPKAEQGVTIAADNNDVVGVVPSYAMPNISSMLPIYSNSDQEFIFRTFNTGNYDLLKHLPDSFKEQQVAAMRGARMDATRRFLMPALSQTRKDQPTNPLGLFSTFEYIPSEYSLADELLSKQKHEGEKKRLEIGGGHEFKTGAVHLPKYKEFDPEASYPRLAGPEEEDPPATPKAPEGGGPDEEHAPKQAPWASSFPSKLGDHPTRLDSFSMMKKLQAQIEKDWQGAHVSIFENETDCWVLKIPLGGTVDSMEGMNAYMNVFARCNDLCIQYQLVKVIEFWGTDPGDGSLYYVLRPPWVKPNRLQTYFSLHPEEKVSKARAQEEDRAAKRAERRKQKQREKEGRSTSDEEEGEEEEIADEANERGAQGWDLDHLNTSALRYSSRINGWHKNFLTNQPTPTPN